MERRRRRVDVGSGNGSSGQVLALSLFIMLLAFFIVLNSISDYEETKVTPILQSLETSFKRKAPPPPTKPSIQKNVKPSVNEGDVTERLKALFRSQIPQYEAATNKSKGTMHVRLPYETFRDVVMNVGGQNNATGSDLEKFFLPTLIAVIRTDKAVRPYRMDMILNMGGNPAHIKNDNPKKAVLDMKAMAGIAEKLERSGLPTRLQSIGMGDGPENTVDLVFRPHVPFDPTKGEKR